MAEEKAAVIERIREYFRLWTQDKRMKSAGQVILDAIDRIEQEEREATRRNGRGGRSPPRTPAGKDSLKRA